LQPPSIVQRIGPNPVLGARQAGVVSSLLSATRLGRMVDADRYDAANAYPITEYLADLKRGVWSGAEPDLPRRQLQRVYLQRLEALLPAPPAAAAPGGAGPGGGGGGGGRPAPFVTAPSLPQSDLPALARMQLREIQRDARAASTSARSATARAHWSDIVERVTAILEP
jgi:hypothetical protein